MFSTDVKKITSKLGYGEILTSLFVLIVIRQYMWIIPNNIAAWSLSFILFLIFLLIHCQFKEKLFEFEKSSILLFILIVIFPLLSVYLLRAAIPDTSGDIIGYHIATAQRTLNGFPYIQGDFFPTGLWTYPPTSSMVLGFFRNLLGYRAGTIGNFLVILWIALIVDKFLLEAISCVIKRYFFVILIISCEYMLIEIHSYMADLLGIPFLLEALWLVHHFERIKNKNYYSFFISLLLGMSVALKLTNLAFVIPICAYLIFKTIRSNTQLKTVYIVFFALAFLFPLFPYSIYMYLQTSNPIFPLYNKIFQSPYWDLSNFKDGRWGPKNLFEVISWPVMSFFVPERFSEFQRYSGRIVISFIAVLYSLFAGRTNRAFLYIWLSGALLWSITTGYVRYMPFLEILGGVIIVYSFFEYEWGSTRIYFKTQKSILSILLIAQVIFAYAFAYKYDWGWRINMFQEPKKHMDSASFFLRDHSFKRFVSSTDCILLEKVEVWLICDRDHTGLETLLKPGLPMINIYEDTFFRLPNAHDRFVKNLESLKTKKIFTVCSSEDLGRCKEIINKRDFVIKETFPLKLQFFSFSGSYSNIFLIEVEPFKAVR